MKKKWIMLIMMISLLIGVTALIFPESEGPEFSLNHTILYFGFLKSSTAQTPMQSIIVNNSGSGVLHWEVSVFEKDGDFDKESRWLKITNLTGSESDQVGVYINPKGLEVGTYDGAVKFTDPDASNSPQMVHVILTVYAPEGDSPPFGSFDSPIDGSIVRSSIPVTGWALDDIGIDKVTIWRDTENNSKEIYIGEAVLVEGPRPDVEQNYPTYPMNYKGGWGYMLLTNMLPNGGNGTFILHAYARDLGGRTVKLGSKTIVCDNVSAVKPFGAIDTPTQGGEVPKAPYSIYRNQGWVLTPMPRKIPVDGSTIKVYIDGKNIGTCTYNIYRKDIATIFPGYANSNGAMAYFDFDADVYETGLHTIQWVATDNAGNTDGIGSRYFYIQNYGYNSQLTRATGLMNSTGKPVTGNTQPRWDCIADLSEISFEHNAPVKVRTGYSEGIEPRELAADENGIIHLTVPQDERIVLELSQQGVQWCRGFLEVNHQLRPLPPGASMDKERAVFYWQPGPASIGKYPLVFIMKSFSDITSKRIFILEITPKFSVEEIRN